MTLARRRPSQQPATPDSRVVTRWLPSWPNGTGTSGHREDMAAHRKYTFIDRPSSAGQPTFDSSPNGLRHHSLGFLDHWATEVRPVRHNETEHTHGDTDEPKEQSECRPERNDRDGDFASGRREIRALRAEWQ